jgi:hypothetical protein
MAATERAPLLGTWSDAGAGPPDSVRAGADEEDDAAAAGLELGPNGVWETPRQRSQRK